MAIIPKDQIEQIRFQNDIADVIGSYLPNLKKQGVTLKCNCPFHQEKTPSFTVNIARQAYHCFGCSAGGDVFGFVMEYEKVDFTSAVQILADRVGFKIIYEGGGNTGFHGKNDVLLNIHEDAVKYYHKLLAEDGAGDEARRYLIERELPESVWKDFKLGFSPNEWNGVLNFLQAKKYKLKDIERAGLIVASERAGKNSYYDRFRNRVLFPIGDQMGRIIGFSGRIMNQAEKGAKYVNSPETPIFHKSRVLFAFDKSRKQIFDKRQAVVVEGQIDAIRCYISGITNVVASQGTALTEDHARLLKRYADEVVLLLDADTAGIKAALASSEIFIAAELSVRIAALPDNEDPDSLILSKGVDSVTSLIETASSALDFLIDQSMQQENVNTEAGKMRIITAVLNLIYKCPGASRKDQMIQHASERLKISPAALQQDLKRLTQQNKRVYQRHDKEAKEQTKVVNKAEYPKEELALLGLLMHAHHDIQPLVHDFLPARLMTNSVCKELLEILVVDLPETLTESLHDFDEEMRRLISRLQVDEPRKVDNETSIIDLAKKYIQLLWRNELTRQQAQLSPDNEEWFSTCSRLKQACFTLGREWESAKLVIETYLLDAP